MNLLITTCARGGSKGIPGKNVKPLNGKPLLHYTLELALACAKKLGADVQLSTDSDLIKECAGLLGYETEYVRPEKLATDSAGKIDAIRDAWLYAENHFQKKYDFVLDMDVTSPLRNMEDLETALSMIQSQPEALNIFSVNPANRNPYFNMVEDRGDGYVQLVKAGSLIKTRQSAPAVYDMNASFYIFSREFMTGDYPISITDRSLIYLVNHICFDLDHPIDFTILQIMMRENLLDFDL